VVRPDSSEIHLIHEEQTMSLAVASGVPSYSSSPSGTRTFIPEIWSGKMIEKFYDATVLAAISNTNY
jgi:hypothetical protein